MDATGTNELHIPVSIREFGFVIERDSIVQRIKLWRSFITSQNGRSALHGRPSRVKMWPAMAMHWNYAMGSVDVAHRLMLQATPSRTTCMSSQKSLVLKFFNVCIVNCYRIWNLFFVNGDAIISWFSLCRTGEQSNYEMRLSAKQLFRRISFHTFVEQVLDILMSMSDNRVSMPLSDGPVAFLPHLKRR